MDGYVVALFATLAGLFILAAWLAIWSRRATPARHVSMAVLLLGFVAVAVVAVEAMGFPKPLTSAWRMNGEARVIGIKMVQDVAIYIYVDRGPGAPRSYVMPWSNAMASKLQGLFDEGENGEFMMKFEWSWERRQPPEFYALPQPIIPLPKNQLPHVPRFGA
jgi:hypothetical protein